MAITYCLQINITNYLDQLGCSNRWTTKDSTLIFRATSLNFSSSRPPYSQLKHLTPCRTYIARLPRSKFYQYFNEHTLLICCDNSWLFDGWVTSTSGTNFSSPHSVRSLSRHRHYILCTHALSSVSAKVLSYELELRSYQPHPVHHLLSFSSTNTLTLANKTIMYYVYKFNHNSCSIHHFYWLCCHCHSRQSVISIIPVPFFYHASYNIKPWYLQQVIEILKRTLLREQRCWTAERFQAIWIVLVLLYFRLFKLQQETFKISIHSPQYRNRIRTEHLS